MCNTKCVMRNYSSELQAFSFRIIPIRLAKIIDFE